MRGDIAVRRAVRDSVVDTAETYIPESRQPLLRSIIPFRLLAHLRMPNKMTYAGTRKGQKYDKKDIIPVSLWRKELVVSARQEVLISYPS